MMVQVIDFVAMVLIAIVLAYGLTMARHVGRTKNEWDMVSPFYGIAVGAITLFVAAVVFAVWALVR